MSQHYRLESNVKYGLKRLLRVWYIIDSFRVCANLNIKNKKRQGFVENRKDGCAQETRAFGYDQQSWPKVKKTISPLNRLDSIRNALRCTCLLR